MALFCILRLSKMFEFNRATIKVVADDFYSGSFLILGVSVVDY